MLICLTMGKVANRELGVYHAATTPTNTNETPPTITPNTNPQMQTTMSFPIICMFRKQAERARKIIQLQVVLGNY